MRQLLVLAVLCLCVNAQTTVNGNRLFLGRVDSSGATQTKPFRSVSTDQTGACSNAAEVTQNTTNGRIFSCIAGNWLLTNSGSGSLGSVTSVGLSMPNIFAVSGSPITTSGSFFVSFTMQSPHVAFLGPVSGGNATPTFRAIDPTDIPALNYENPLIFSNPFVRATNTLSCPSCVVSTGNYSDPGWITGLSWGKLLNVPPFTYQLVGIGGSSQTARNRLNLIQGTNVTLTVADNAGTNSTDVTISAAGGGGGSAYSTFASSGTPVAQRSQANFSNEFTVADNSGAGRTDLSISSISATKIAGDISGNAQNVNGVTAVANGGTSATTKGGAFDALSPTTALGDIIFRGVTGSNSALHGNTTTTPQFLRQTGTGTASAAPVWATLGSADIPDLSATYQPRLGFTAESVSNKSTDTALGGGSPSNTAYPSQAAVKSYVDTHSSAGSPAYEANINGTSITIPQTTHLKGQYPIMRLFNSAGVIVPVQYSVNGSGDITFSAATSDNYHVKITDGREGSSGAPYENDYTSVTSISVLGTTHGKGLYPTVALFTGGAYVPVVWSLNGSGDLTVGSLSSANYHIKVF